MHELLGLLPNSVEISEIWETHGVCLWESKLVLDLMWHKRQSFRSVVLNSSWSWDVEIWTQDLSGLLHVSDEWLSLVLPLGPCTYSLHAFEDTSHFCIYLINNIDIEFF